MRELAQAIPDVEAVLAMAPEELGAKVLFLLRRRAWTGAVDELGRARFHLGNLTAELRDSSAYPEGRRTEVQAALIEAFAFLEGQGLIVPALGNSGSHERTLSRRALSFADEAEYVGFRIARLLPREALHPEISEKIWLAFMRGDYALAVFEAFKRVEIQLRAASRADAGLSAVKVANFAFNPENGPLTDQESEGGERQASRDLFAGALGYLKNPYSHRDVDYDHPVEAASAVMFASLLLRILDSRKPGVDAV